MSNFGFRTCSDTLPNPGQCCVCRAPATRAVLTADFTEHTRCGRHATGALVEAIKPLKWASEWAPEERA